MTDYYKLKRQAEDIIDSMLAEGKDEAIIEWRIGKMFGFGKGLINKRRDLIERLQQAKEKENIKNESK